MPFTEYDNVCDEASQLTITGCQIPFSKFGKLIAVVIADWSEERQIWPWSGPEGEPGSIKEFVYVSNSKTIPFWMPLAPIPSPFTPMALIPAGSLWNTIAIPSAPPPSLFPKNASNEIRKFYVKSTLP